MKCVAKVTKALGDIGIVADVTLAPPAVHVKSGTATLEAMNSAVAAAGSYRIVAGEAVAGGKKSWAATYYPLLLIVGLISLASFRGAEGLHQWMLHFMAGFFIVFGFFKLLDIRGFQSAYAGYDLLAAKWPAYGLAYPFIELALGFAFLFGFQVTVALWVSLVLMLFGSIGVLRAVLNKRKIRCACLGTALNLPMSTVTVVEDLGMAVMAAWMLMV